MSYSVEYDPQYKKYYPPKVKHIRKPPVKLLVAAIMIAVFTYIVVSTDIKAVLLPGDPQITAAAFSDMVQRVGDGEPVADAVYSLFRDIIIGGMNE